MLTLYGIVNCDSCRAARRWLDSHAIAHVFHDVREDGLDRSLLQRLAKAAGWQTLLNKRSRTWKEVPAAKKEGIDQRRAISLLLANPTLMKRPVLDGGDAVLVGFSASEYAAFVARC